MSGFHLGPPDWCSRKRERGSTRDRIRIREERAIEEGESDRRAALRDAPTTRLPPELVKELRG